MKHKAGFVSIIGKPNVGKSTLLNAIIGENLSAVTHKAQTTRHRIKGMLNGKDYQIVFSDTPGIIKPAYKLHERMMEAVDSTFADADVVVLVIECGDRKINEEIDIRLKKINSPLIVVLNKVDKSHQDIVVGELEFWKSKFDRAEVIPVSALEKFNLELLVNMMVNRLPEGPAYYDKNEVSDRSVRFFVTEIIRQQLLIQYQKEIPYSCEVTVTDYKEEKKIDKIRCEISVDRESQKGIILGNKGLSIKKLGTISRINIEKLTGKKVYIELTVKVKGDWRNDSRQLNRFGYEE
jgi:GTPase